MSASHGDRRLPGDVLLRVARACTSQATFEALVIPAVADLQHEVEHARPGMARRLAYARGVWACWRVLLLAPFAAAPVPDGNVILGGSGSRASDPSVKGAPLLSALLAVLLASSWPFLGLMAIAIPVCGLLLAVALHWWYLRHPASQQQAGIPTRWRAAEINFASIPVSGNVGGLLAAVGSVAVILIGVPGMPLFLAGSVVCGMLTAFVLAARRRNGPAAAGRFLKAPGC